MSTDKVKIYKNPERDTEEVHKQYVPQYQLRGVTPANSGGNTRAVVVKVEPEAVNETTISNRRGSIPNIGNGMEHTWSGVDGNLVDDLPNFDPNHPMIDNNEYVTYQDHAPPTTNPVKAERDSFKEKVDEDLSSILSSLKNEEYILIINGVAICSGPMLEIQEQATALVFGEHQLCDGKEIPVDDIIILKKVKIKMGLFLE